MNITTLPMNNTITMTSREIAELVDSRHDSVQRSIERLAQNGVIRLPPTVISEIINNLGLPQKVSEYVFTGEQGKRDSIVVVAQLSPEFTARLVDRWQELEAALAKPALPDFSNPAAAARAWADEYEQRLSLQAKVEEDAPKVEFYDDVTGSDDTIDIGTVAKVLNRPKLGRNNLFAFLRGKKVLDRHNAPYQRYIDMGWFRQIETKWQKPNGDWQIGIKTVVFQKGVEGIRKLVDGGAA
jgi:phage antirepressor protein